jgi:hypothetical protein
MEIMWHLGVGLSRSIDPHVTFPTLTVAARADLMQKIDGPSVLSTASAATLGDSLGTRLVEIASASAPLIPELPDDLMRLAFALRFWSGCADAGKLLRDVAADGTPQGYTIQRDDRENGFRHVDQRAALDPVYCAGVEAAPTWRRTKRNETNHDEGVPPTSPVRRYWMA